MDSSITTAEDKYAELLDQTVPPAECDICQGSVERSLAVAERLISKLSSLEFDTFLVGCSLADHLEKSDKILSEYVDDYQDLKFEIRKEVGLRVVNALGKEVDFQYPDITVLIDTSSYRFELDIRSLYILGRYKKLTRGIPQTKWPCSNCRGKGCASCNQTGQQYPKTVETIISPYFMEKSNARGASFHGAGREDIDALMLGTGRPFVLELKEPQFREIDLQEAESVINAQDDVKINDLRFCDKDTIVFLKEGSPNASKTYRALVEVEREIDADDILDINRFGSTPHILEQRTPTRVNHRRVDKVREKSIYGVRAKPVDDHHLELDISAQGGAYIKEFISSDEGRTSPSIAEILSSPAVCTELDVIAVDDRGLFSS